MATEPASLEIMPGAVNAASKTKDSLSWREVNLVRWNNGNMEPVLGWDKYDYTAPAAHVKRVHQWYDNSGNLWVAYLCDGYLYVEYDGDLVDISPTPAMEAFSADFAAGGYGDDSYGTGAYGEPRSASPDRREIGPWYSMDNWGEDLLVMSSADGRLLKFTPAFPPVACDVVSGAPTNNRGFIVTPERFVMLFGAGGTFNEFAWCDQEDLTDWTPGTTSKAGSYPVEPAAPIVAAINMGDGGNLFFTSSNGYVTRYIGEPYIYTEGDDIGAGMAPVSPQSLSRVLGGAMWMTQAGPYVFNGQSVSPVACPIWEWINSQIDWTYARFTSFSVNMVDKGEFWWFFPEAGNQYNTRVVIYNYRDQWWSMGKLARSAAFSSNFTVWPIMADRLEVFRHDSGNRYPGAEELPWAESFNVNLKKGGVFTQVNQIRPEVVGSYDKLRFSLAYRTKRTNDDEVYSTPRAIQLNGAVDFGENNRPGIVGRDFRLRIDHSGSSVLPWSMGQILVSAVPRGIKP